MSIDYINRVSNALLIVVSRDDMCVKSVRKRTYQAHSET